MVYFYVAFHIKNYINFFTMIRYHQFYECFMEGNYFLLKIIQEILSLNIDGYIKIKPVVLILNI